ncbi:hypothetical protein FR742_10730 [Nonomuraea sp. C10]|nr:hypothetical protein FR742_10730 [Nonomuraea sp. C10]
MDVLVCGAGVAGAALAYWVLHHGFTPTVVERAPRVRAGGCAAGLRGEALDVLDRMALLERAEALDLRLGDAAMAPEYAALPVAVRAGDLGILRDDLVAGADGLYSGDPLAGLRAARALCPAPGPLHGGLRPARPLRRRRRRPGPPRTGQGDRGARHPRRRPSPGGAALRLRAAGLRPR